MQTAIILNFGWVTVACILGVAVCFKKFETNFSHESVWAICVFALALAVFTVNSVLYGQLLYGGVFSYVNFCLYAKYKKWSESKGYN